MGHICHASLFPEKYCHPFWGPHSTPNFPQCLSQKSLFFLVFVLSYLHNPEGSNSAPSIQECFQTNISPMEKNSTYCSKSGSILKGAALWSRGITQLGAGDPGLNPGSAASQFSALRKYLTLFELLSSSERCLTNPSQGSYRASNRVDMEVGAGLRNDCYMPGSLSDSNY